MTSQYKLLRKMIPNSVKKQIRKIHQRKWRMHGGVIPQLGLMLTSACNLNCRECSDLIPYRDIYVYRYDELIKDLKKILLSVNGIDTLLVAGGEVMLYKDLTKVLQFCAKEEKIRKVILITNGTIMPSDDIWDTFNDKMTIRVSGYRSDVAPNHSNIINEAKRRHINFEDLGDMDWRRIGNNKPRKRSYDEMEYIFQNCAMSHCIGLVLGKIFFCSRQQAAYFTTDYPTPFSYEFIDVRNSGIKEIKRKLINFYNLPFISTCEFCDGLNYKSERIDSARQILKTKEFYKLLDILYELSLLVNQDLNKCKNECYNIITMLKELLVENEFNLRTVNGYGQILSLINLEPVKKAEINNLYKYTYNFVRCLSIDYRPFFIDHEGFSIDERKMFDNKRNVLVFKLSEDEDRIGYDRKKIHFIQTLFNDNQWKTYG